MPEIPREVVETSEVEEVPAKPAVTQQLRLTQEHLERIRTLMIESDTSTVETKIKPDLET
ncbi:hypothetical protein KBD71_05360 [Candidatus Woesebacteria bacterium]|nr:hypothetical protein [Candidatus Woesebacteria bacterium]